MINYYYTENIHLEKVEDNLEVLEATGWKTISIYDIDTQYISMVEVHSEVCTLDKDSEEFCEKWLQTNYEDGDFNLIRL